MLHWQEHDTLRNRFHFHPAWRSGQRHSKKGWKSHDPVNDLGASVRRFRCVCQWSWCKHGACSVNVRWILLESDTSDTLDAMLSARTTRSTIFKREMVWVLLSRMDIHLWPPKLADSFSMSAKTGAEHTFPTWFGPPSLFNKKFQSLAGEKHLLITDQTTCVCKKLSSKLAVVIQRRSVIKDFQGL